MANPTVPDFTDLGARKLADLLAKGYVITGVCFERQVEGTQPQRGFVDFAGFVGWWKSVAKACGKLTQEPCEINNQGPRLNHALSETHGDVCIVYVDFGSKRFNVSGSGSDDEVPSVSIDPCDQLQGWECADVVFPNRKGWDVVSASSSKYTLTAVLKRTAHGVADMKGGQDVDA